MSVRKDQDVYVSSAGELENLPIVAAWSVVKCSDPNCPAVHLFLFDTKGKPISHLPLDKESAGEFVRDIMMALDTGRPTTVN